MLRRAAIALVFAAGLALWSAPQATAQDPPNDNFANATTFSGNSGSAYEDIYSATNEPGEPQDHGVRTIWFRWTPSEGGRVFVNTCSERTTPDTVLAAYTGTSLHALTRVALNDEDDGCWFNGPSAVEFNAVANTTYYFSVGYYEHPSPWPFGDYVDVYLRNYPHPPNDNFASAHPLNETFPSVEGDTYSGTKEPGEPAANGSNTQWYRWTAPRTGTVLVDTCSPSGFWGELSDTVLAAYTGSAVNALNQVALNDDVDGCGNGRQSRISWPAVAGTTYRISVGSFGSRPGGRFLLKLRMPPPHDNFANAKTLTSPVEDYNVGATREPGEPADNGQSTVWYRWTAPKTGEARIDTGCGGGIDSILTVYTGSALGSLTEVAQNDNGDFCGNASRVRYPVTAGDVYYLSVGTAPSGVDGTFSVTATVGNAPNDQFADRLTLQGRSATTEGDNTDATSEPGQPIGTGPRSLWYRWTPTGTGTVTMDTCTATSFRTTLSVYTGSSVDALTLVARDYNNGDPACGSKSRLSFNAVAGTTYQISVAGFQDVDYGTFRLSLNQDVPSHALTVAVSGPGTVVSDPAGIDCGSDCSQAYDLGTSVELIPVPTAGSTVAGWSGACSGTSACTVTMSQARSVTATFTLAPQVLTVTKAGSGQGTVTSSPGGINCGNDCSQGYDAGELVTLTATPAAGSSFAGWSDTCSGTSTCQVTMSEARSVTATFTANVTGPTGGDPPGPTGEDPPGPPETVIEKAKIKKNQATAKFTFDEASEAKSKFQCKLSNQSKDLREWRKCTSPESFDDLKVGMHVFSVRAISDGVTDPTPATEQFRIPADN